MPKKLMSKKVSRIIHVRLINYPWRNKLKSRKTLKKDISKELPVAWCSTRRWVWCMSEDEKKGKEPGFTD